MSDASTPPPENEANAVRAPKTRSPPRPLPDSVTRFLRRRSQKRHRQGMKSGPWIKLIALAGGLLLVGALAHDLSQESRRVAEMPRIPADDDPGALVLGFGDRMHTDPENKFRIRVPGPWAVYTGAAVHPYRARFFGPREMEVAVLVSPFKGSFDRLRRQMEAQEKKWGGDSNIRVVTIADRTVVKRSFRLLKKTVHTRDFLTPGLSHHLQAAVAHDHYGAMLPLLVEILDTYEPGPFAP